ncbi:MAG: tRNA 2-thiouridine(34) synthase MnmA, partial [Bilophila sp.]
MIAVAVSGGADSLYALASLKRTGAEVFALHARFKKTPDAVDPVPELESRCRELGLVLRVRDMRERFAELIVRPFAESYVKGETPNPCVRCNALIKFGLLLEEARALGADRLATGHYVALVDHPRYGLALRSGADPAKDQSYFLALTPLTRLQQALFPLGDITKTEVRHCLEEWHL